MKADPREFAAASVNARPAALRERLFGFFEVRRNRYCVYATLAAVALAVPLVANNYALEVLSNAWFYCILCLGLNIVIGYAGLLDLGYAAFFAVGAYTTAILTSHFGVNFWLTIPVAPGRSACGRRLPCRLS